MYNDYPANGDMPRDMADYRLCLIKAARGRTNKLHIFNSCDHLRQAPANTWTGCEICVDLPKALSTSDFRAQYHGVLMGHSGSTLIRL